MKKLKFTKSESAAASNLEIPLGICQLTNTVYEIINDVLDLEQKARKSGLALDANVEEMLAVVHSMYAGAINYTQPQKKAGAKKAKVPVAKKRGRPKGSKNAAPKRPGKRGRPKGSKNKPKAE